MLGTFSLPVINIILYISIEAELIAIARQDIMESYAQNALERVMMAITLGLAKQNALNATAIY
jgi:hypothetical protein